MNNDFWKVQKMINENNSQINNMLIEQVKNLIEVAADHERTMIQMCERIDELNKRILELQGSH